MIQSDKYKDWDILQEMPKGWKIDKTVGSPVFDCVFITNGKSVINGQKRALLRIKQNVIIKTVTTNTPIVIKDETVLQKKEHFFFPSKSVNILARKKFQEQLLKEIMFDLMVCEIEGWDKLEYIKELKKLINGINVRNIREQRKLNPQQKMF